jgi:hypothetical protein
MSIYSIPSTPATDYGVLRTGVFIGAAGGLAEMLVVWLYSALTGGDTAMVARHVAYAIGLDGASAMTGVGVHMALAIALGIALSAVAQTMAGRRGAIFFFMIGSLAVVWAINYFVVLPVISPGFVHLLPYAVTFASKLAFGFAAAATFQMVAGADRRSIDGSTAI